MIGSQRKVHRLIWLVMAVILPVLLFFATKDLEFGSKPYQDQEQLEVKLTKNKTVLIELKKPFPNASSVIYEVDSNGNLGKLLGQFQGMGTYEFELSDTASGIAVVDKLKNTNIYTTTF